MIITKYKINCAAPRLSDEEPDLMEQEDVEGITSTSAEGWVPWTHDDLIDIRKIMESKMPVKQREVVEAFLMGNTAADLDVTEKYWRYHLKRALELIRKEMGI